MVDIIWKDITRENCKDYDIENWVVVVARECGYTLHETFHNSLIFMKGNNIAYMCHIDDINTIESIANSIDGFK